MQDLAAFIVTDPVAHPVPLHPAKVEPVAALADKVTAVPLLKVVEQVLPQLMPAGELVTVPLPVPTLTTERPKVWVDWRLNVAVQDVAAFIVTEPVAHPVPLQPAKVEPAAALADKVTGVLLL